MLQGRTSLEVFLSEIGARRVAELLWRLHYGIAAGSPERVHIYRRIADHRHPIWDGTGTAVLAGRWNNVGRPLIDASAAYACAMLGVVAQGGSNARTATRRSMYRKAWRSSAARPKHCLQVGTWRTAPRHEFSALAGSRRDAPRFSLCLRLSPESNGMHSSIRAILTRRNYSHPLRYP
jgi:hypothetical protein